MKKYLEKELLVSAAYVDRDCEMGPFHASLLFQDGMTELFHQYGWHEPEPWHGLGRGSKQAVL